MRRMLGILNICAGVLILGLLIFLVIFAKGFPITVGDWVLPLSFAAVLMIGGTLVLAARRGNRVISAVLVAVDFVSAGLMLYGLALSFLTREL